MKKMFLGLAFAAISFLSSNVFAMAHEHPVRVTDVFRQGNIVHLTFSDNATILYNTTDGHMQLFASDGTEVQPVPGYRARLTLETINNRGFMGRVVDVAVPVASVLGAYLGACIIQHLCSDKGSFHEFLKNIVTSSNPFQFMSLMQTMLTRKNGVNHEYWAHNCWAALERGGSDYIRAGLTCPVAGASYFPSEVIVSISAFVVLFVLIYKCLSDKPQRFGH